MLPRCQKELFEDLEDRAFRESGVVVDEACKAVFVSGGACLFNDGALNEVAGIELCQVIGARLSVFGKLGCC